MPDFIAALRVTTERASAEGRDRVGRARIDATQLNNVLALPARLRARKVAKGPRE